MLAALLLLPLYTSAQNISGDYPKEAVEAALLRQKHNYEMDMYQRFTGYRYKPYVGATVGFMRFYGDVQPAHNAVTDLGTVWGLSVAVPTGESERWLVNLNTLFGTLHSAHADFSSAVDNLNFFTRATQLDISLTYQHRELFEKLRPYASVGVGLLRFNPMGNLTDAEGRPYLYPYPARYPDNVALAKAGNMHVDYDRSYETDLRRRNLYGDGSYARTAAVLPLELGVSFPLGSFFSVRMAYLFTYTFTDHLDNVSGATARAAQQAFPHEEARAALNAAYPAYHLDNSPDKARQRAAALRAGTGNDAYGGLHVSVYVRLFTSTKKIHDKVYTGSTLKSDDVVLYQQVMLSEDEDGGAPKSRFTPSAREEEALRRRRIPRRFRGVDSNGDGVISSIEMNDAVEQYIDGTSPLKRKELVRLQKFYRSQRK